MDISLTGVVPTSPARTPFCSRGTLSVNRKSSEKAHEYDIILSKYRSGKNQRDINCGLQKPAVFILIYDSKGVKFSGSTSGTNGSVESTIMKFHSEQTGAKLSEILELIGFSFIDSKRGRERTIRM